MFFPRLSVISASVKHQMVQTKDAGLVSDAGCVIKPKLNWIPVFYFKLFWFCFSSEDVCGCGLCVPQRSVHPEALALRRRAGL